MLRHQDEAAFERWLAQCPLDSRNLSYSVARGGDGILTVECQWRLAAALPSAAVGAPTCSTAGTSSSSSELHDARKMLEAVQQRVAAASAASEASQKEDGEQSRSSPAAMMAMLAMQQKLMDDGADRPPPSREEIRKMMALASGSIDFPKPPGAA